MNTPPEWQPISKSVLVQRVEDLCKSTRKLEGELLKEVEGKIRGLKALLEMQAERNGAVEATED